MFDLDDSVLEVCAKHRHNLGKFWRPSTAYLYPKHEGRPGQKSSKSRYSVSLDMSKTIQEMFGIFVPVSLLHSRCFGRSRNPYVPVGSVICNNCRNRHNAIVKDLLWYRVMVQNHRILWKQVLLQVLDEVSSLPELTGIAGQDIVFQFNTTGKNAGIKAAKFGLDDGNQDDPVPKFITVLIKNGKPEETLGDDLKSSAASYKGRVSFAGNLTKGQAWFQISHLMVTDTNHYMCKISEDSDAGYKRTNRVKLTVLKIDKTRPPITESEAKYTDFEGYAKKKCKSYRLLHEENTPAVENVLGQAYRHMFINHKIKMKPISTINKTVTAWFHIRFNEAINRSYAFSFLKKAQQNNKLGGYNITCFEKLDLKLVPVK